MKNIALIGVGGHGRIHLALIEKLEQQRLVKLQCVADPNTATLPECHQSLTEKKVRWYYDYRRMLHEQPDLDAIVICTPIHLHEAMLKDALDTSRARILLEKPAFPTLRQLDWFIDYDKLSRVRVGFHMIHWPEISRLKQWVTEGPMGPLKSVVIAAGWPRPATYYTRTNWAGKMAVNNQPVFDGPATNALAHLLHNASYLLGGDFQSFAEPDSVSAVLCRARNIEAYDTFWMKAQFDHVEVDVLLTHSISELIPYRMELTGELGTATFRETWPRLSGTMGLNSSDIGEKTPDSKIDMYYSLLGDNEVFARMPNRLSDVRGYTMLTNMALASSNGIIDVPNSIVEESLINGESYLNIRGLSQNIRHFLHSPRSFAEMGYEWAENGTEITAKELGSFDFYCESSKR